MLDNATMVIAPARDSSARPWAALLPGSILQLEPRSIRPAPGISRLVTWSGTLAGDPFGDDPRTWGPAGWSALLAACDRLSDRLREGGATLALRTHARHILSDGPSCQRFLAEVAAPSGHRRGFEVLLDPDSMLTGSMRADTADHISRLLEALCGKPGVCGIVIPGKPVTAPDDDGSRAPVPAGYERAFETGVPLIFESAPTGA